MKVFVIFFVAFLAISIEAKGHKSKAVKNNDFSEAAVEESQVDWPNPGLVSGFDVPDAFNDGGAGGLPNADGYNEPSSGKHHGKLHKEHRN